MSEPEQYGKLADELEDRADALADENEQLGKRIAGAREQWERTRKETGAGTPDWDDPEDDPEDEDEDEDEEDDDHHDDEDEAEDD
jgi:hypothetical protein